MGKSTETSTQYTICHPSRDVWPSNRELHQRKVVPPSVLIARNRSETQLRYRMPMTRGDLLRDYYRIARRESLVLLTEE